jgi:hypothetical protein
VVDDRHMKITHVVRGAVSRLCYAPECAQTDMCLLRVGVASFYAKTRRVVQGIRLGASSVCPPRPAGR